MKHKHTAVVAAASLVACLLSHEELRADATSPLIPVGSLSASPNVVQIGTRPTLDWSISYPSVVEDFVVIEEPGTVIPKQDLICDVRVLGAGVTTQNSNGSINYIRTAGKMRFNGNTSWTSVFDGRNTDTIVQQQGIIKTYLVRANRSIDFGGQYYWNSKWSTFYNSANGYQVRTLVDGDTPPSNIPDYNAPSLESFVRPYLDASGKVNIGPMDVIVFMELTHTDSNHVGFDLQDLVFLVTFRVP